MDPLKPLSRSNLLLNLDDLNNRHEVSEINRKKLFDGILKSCHNKIKKYNKEFKKQECLFTPPVFVLGHPPYNFVNLITYLVESLQSNGLKTQWIPKQKAIYVSWKPDDVDLSQYHSRFQNEVYNEDMDNEFEVLKIQPQVAPPPKAKSKKNEAPPVQHVAMVQYNNRAQELIPINAKSLKITHGGLRP